MIDPPEMLGRRVGAVDLRPVTSVGPRWSLERGAGRDDFDDDRVVAMAAYEDG